MAAALALTAAVVFATTGCAEDRPDTRDRGDEATPFAETVTITPSGYRPREARVLVGGTVTFINRDPRAAQTAETAPGAYERLPGGQDASFDTHTLTWEEPYTVTFHVPGTFAYHSSYSAITGRVHVISRPPPN